MEIKGGLDLMIEIPRVHLSGLVTSQATSLTGLHINPTISNLTRTAFTPWELDINLPGMM